MKFNPFIINENEKKSSGIRNQKSQRIKSEDVRI